MTATNIGKRKFLYNSVHLLGYAGLAMTLPGCQSGAASTTKAKGALTDVKAVTPSHNTGFQLYTVREQLTADPEGTLRQIADIGYTEVELAGLPKGVTASEFRSLLDDTGLRCPAMHVQGDVESQAAIAHAVGAKLAVMPVPMPLLNEQWQLREGLTLDDFRRFAASLVESGKAYRKEGIHFGFHNHAWELVRIDDQLAYQVILDETDPALVFMELDLGWLHVGQINAGDLIAKNAGRFRTCHIKDFDAAGTMVDPGQGSAQLAQTLEHTDRAGFEHFFVEHDNSSYPLQSAANGYQFLKQQPGF